MPDGSADPVKRALDGDIEGAISALRRELGEAPDDEAAWLALGMVYSSAGRWREASEALARAVELDGEALATRLAFARALEKSAKLDDAAFQLVQAERIAPGDVRPLKELAAIFYKKGLYDKAVRCLVRARALAPGDARVFYSLGLAQEARRDPGAAIACYRDAIRLDPAFSDARRTLADVLAAMGEHEQAITVLDELLRRERSNEQAAVNREVLSRALDEMRARRLLGKTEREVEASALVQEGKLERRDRLPRGDDDPPEVVSVIRYGAKLSEVRVGLTDAGAVATMMLILPDPAGAANKRDDVFRVTVVGESGRREPANYATGVTLTFLREALGAPMTEAGELYAKVLAGRRPLEWGGARLSFASVPGSKVPGDELHGLAVTASSGRGET